MQDALEIIQTKIAFLERANADLSDVVFRQQREIEALSGRLRSLAERLAVVADEQAAAPADERPPHY
jgi:SlyX protein